MKEYILFLKDKSVVSAIIIILLIEASMQFGCYNKLLKKSSYASNVNRITDHVLSKKNELDPDILIMGTSLAYEGISLKQLNEKLKPLHLKAQSIAIPGAELLVQQLAVEKVLTEFKNVKYIIHVNEAEMPWTVGTILSTPTLAMASEFNRIREVEKIKEDEYTISMQEYFYIVLKLWAYRHDLADFILNPEKRIKDISRARTIYEENLYAYENKNQESLELYAFHDLDSAIELTKNNAPIANGSNQYHKDAIYKTCKLAKETNVTLDETPSTLLFKKRLTNFYSVLRKKNIKIINVFPPLSIYLGHFQHKKRIEFWKEKYKIILGTGILDLTDCIPKENNASYYYDIVHANQKGMKIFTDTLGESFIHYLNTINKEDNNAL